MQKHGRIFADYKRTTIYGKYEEIVFFLDRDTERVKRFMERCNIYGAFKTLVRQQRREHAADTPFFAVLQTNDGLQSDIFCYFDGYENAEQNGLAHYYFADRFRQQDLIAAAHEDIEANTGYGKMLARLYAMNVG